MTGALDVDGGLLLAHAKGSRAQADNFTGLARLLEQARMHDECFGPLGRVAAQCYFTALEECQTTAGKASSYLAEIADALDATAKAYGATDADNATGLTSAGKGVGSLGDLNGAGNDERDSDFHQVAKYGMSTVDSYDKVADTGVDEPAQGAFAVFNARMEQLSIIASPGKALVDNGLGFLVSLAISPLVNFVLEPAVGDPEQMRSTAKGWEKVGEWLDKVADHESDRARATETGWQGEAGDAFRVEMAEFAEGARALGGDVGELQGILETAADIFDTFVQVVVDIIQEFVIGLIIEWLAALAASWITAGASTVAATGLTASQVAITTSRLGTKVATLMHRLKPLITNLEKVLRRVRQNKIVEGAVSKADRIDNIPLIGKPIGRGLDNLNPVAGMTRHHTGDVDEAVKGVSKYATTSPNNFIGSKVPRKPIRPNDPPLPDHARPSDLVDLAGEQALAQRVVRTGLGFAGLSGTTDIGRVVVRGTLENVPGAVVEWGLKQIDEHAQDPSSDEERAAVEKRGFAVD
ncbi:WXG100 family type VII secretion target [Actinokineospora auranticolor]|uniref:Outer membrane channel protein CpnT-like N-terminal domain-containing protein n=1 Tax=Actinokineospora auranticolor TaxID=155976 RepID=A0A2S6GSY1_9PSEU|nr:hypothetical protein [Actinokineospora auranticolor]PPK68283.1 hypothetical protein CLV40_1056 [Actinokineospora auranticolor]